MKRWLFLLVGAWATIVISLFLATLTGSFIEKFELSRNVVLLSQGIVMSGLVIPIILYLYKHVYKMKGVKPNKPVYSWKSAYHFMTGLMLSISLAFLGFVIAIYQGWIVIEEWHGPRSWLIALLINAIIAFLYEALPEELALRGIIYDVLRHRFVAWLAVLMQTVLFLSVPLAVSQLQVFVGMSSENMVSAPYIILIFCFGICLQLLRQWTKSIWTSIGFHLGYLELTRFVVMPSGYGAPPIITYQDTLHGLGGVFISLVMIVLGGIIVSLIILTAQKFYRKKSMN